MARICSGPPVGIYLLGDTRGTSANTDDHVDCIDQTQRSSSRRLSGCSLSIRRRAAYAPGCAAP